MAYIYLEELKECLPIILSDWIEPGDEGWEWIFQEIEQKCHVGKKKKKEPVNCGTCKYFVSNNGVGHCDGGVPCYGHSQWEKKKDKKPKKKDMQNAMEIAIVAHQNDINELTKKVDELNNKISNLSDRYTVMVERVNKMHQDISAAKSMAETAKQRTEVDYSKYSGKSDGKIGYDNTNNDVNQWQINNKCASCKHIRTETYDQPCVVCCYNGMNISGMDKWEEKDE